MRSIFLSKLLKETKQTLHHMDMEIPDILLTTFVGAGVGLFEGAFVGAGVIGAGVGCLVGWAVGYK